MEIRPIHTDADYRAVLREVSAYFENEPEPGTPDGDRFEVLVTLVEAYEAKHFPIDLPDPVEAIKFRMRMTSPRRVSTVVSSAATSPRCPATARSRGSKPGSTASSR